MTILLRPVARTRSVQIGSERDEARVPVDFLETRFSHPIPGQVWLKEKCLPGQGCAGVGVSSCDMLLPASRGFETSQSTARNSLKGAGSRTHQIRLPLPSDVCERDHLVRLGLFQQPLQTMPIGPFQLLGIHRHPRTGHPGQSVLHVSDRISEPFDRFVVMTQGAIKTDANHHLSCQPTSTSRISNMKSRLTARNPRPPSNSAR
jgi:hypothetical protein